MNPASDPEHPPLNERRIRETMLRRLSAAPFGDLGEAVIGRSLDIRATTVSTNDDATQLGRSGAEEGLVIFAEHQTAGRGRRGDRWESPPRRDLLLSLLLRPRAPVDVWSRLAHLGALAICRSLEEYCALQPRIKWPNDVYVEGRKLAGLLVETRHHRGEPPFAVLGMGINLNSEVAFDFPRELRPIAVTVREAMGGALVDRSEFAGVLLAWLNECYQLMENFDRAREAIADRSLLLGERVRLVTGSREIEGEVTGLERNGELILRTAGGETQIIYTAENVRLIEKPARNPES